MGAYLWASITLELDIRILHSATFLAQILALTRTKGLEIVLKGSIASIEPVKLRGDALVDTLCGKQFALTLTWK